MYVYTGEDEAHAYRLGSVQAETEREDFALSQPADDVWNVSGDNTEFDIYEQQKDVLFRVTGYKIEPDEPAGEELLGLYENGYYDWWDDNGSN